MNLKMLGYLLVVCIILCLAILIFVVLYLYQARWRTSTLPDLNSHSVKLMTAYDITNNTETNIFPTVAETKWKHTINRVEDACARDQKTYQSIKLSFNTKTKHSMVNVHADLPDKEELNGRTIVLYVNGSFTGFFSSQPKIRRTIHRSGPFALQLPLNVMFHEVLPNEKYVIVGFDWPTNSPLHLNFGQKYDIEVLNYVYRSLLSRTTDKIILMADCLGALKLLNWMVKQNPNELEKRTHAIILISPITCLNDFLHQLTGWGLLDQSIVPPIVRSGCANYVNESEYVDWFLNKPWTAFPQVPLFLATVKGDTISTAEKQVPLILEKFPNSHPQTVFENSDTVVGKRTIKHGMLNHVPAFRYAVQRFLEEEIVH